MVWPFAASFFAGFLTKHADESKKNDGLFAGCLYGFLLAWAASMDAFVAVVFVPAILANLIVGKIDSKAHALALSAFVVFIFYLKIPAFVLRCCAF
jgi:hypothetical protein